MRGYPESDYGVDQGILTNVEYWIPFFLVPGDWKFPYADRPLRQQIQFIAFVDQGYGQLRDPSATERRSRTLLGIGGGIVVQLTRHVTGRIEWAGAAAQDPLTEGGNSQVHFRIQTDL